MRASLFLGIAGVVVSTAALAADPTATQGPDTWRASKLIGVPIYGPDTVTVGKIDDLLLGHDGKVVTVVIGVGGFLGVGEKDVAVPYDQVKFEAVPIAPPANPVVAPNDPMAGGAAPPAASALPAGTAGLAPPTASVPAAAGAIAPAPAPPPPSTAYPDHGTIAMTKAELKALPTFQFAK